GLQNEAAALPTEQKARFIEALARAGLSRIETTAFVHPKWVPQMADAEALCALLPHPAPPGVRFSALVPHPKGRRRALAASVIEIAVVVSATETFNRMNLNAGVEETLEEIDHVSREAARVSVPVRAYLSVSFVCPYEGPVSPDRVLPVAERLAAMGA